MLISYILDVFIDRVIKSKNNLFLIFVIALDLLEVLSLVFAFKLYLF